MHAFHLDSARTFLVKKWPHILALFCSVLLPLLLLGKLADNVWDNAGYGHFWFDEPILNFLHAHATTRKDPIVVFITRFGSPPLMLLMGVLVVGFLWLRKRRGDAAFFFVAVVGAGVLNLVAKAVFGRTRPDLWISIAPEADYSFPSGHAMGTMALAAALVYLAWHTRQKFVVLALAIFFVLAIGLSRLYLGVHYPSDILGGWCASLAWVSGLHAIRRLRGKHEKSTPE